MCSCENNLTIEQRFGVPEGTPCSEITISLLQLYKKPIDCYIQYNLANVIEQSHEELLAASEYLSDFISRKVIDDNDCTGIENLMNIRALVHLIVQKGICL